MLADRSTHAHVSDLAELEAAVSLTARLVTARVTAAAGDGVGSGAGVAAARLQVVNEFIPQLDALTVRLSQGDGKYDAFIAAASPEGSPATSTSSALVARRLAVAAKGAAAAVGGLPYPTAAAAAARIERSLRTVRAALVTLNPKPYPKP